MGKEILTRLNPKTQTMEQSGHGHGETTSLDIAACCAGCDKAGLSVLLERVAGNREVHQRDFYSLYQEVVGVASSQRWKVKKDQIRTLLQIALFEHCQAGTCPSCKGTRFQISDPSKPCRRCKGAGKHMLHLNDKAEALKVAKKTWLDVWEARFHEVLSILQDKEYEAMRVIYRRLE